MGVVFASLRENVKKYLQTKSSKEFTTYAEPFVIERKKQKDRSVK